MRYPSRIILAAALAVSVGTVFGQDGGAPTVKAPAQRTPTPTPTPVAKLSELLAKNADGVDERTEVPREKREQAYAKLLEGQRYVWSIKRSRSQAALNGRLAKQAFQRAVELDPTLAEAYTALAELSWNLPPNDLDEAIRLALIATKIDRDNFGGQRILARGYTLKSRLNRGELDKPFAEKAVAVWNEVARLDPRNAEAWAFLSDLQVNEPDKRIAALKNWLSAAQPLDTYFYRTLMGGQANLAPESAAIRLGIALLEAKRYNESVEVLNQVIADDPDDPRAPEALAMALEYADAQTAATSVQAIQQAIYSAPENMQLVLLLVKVQSRTGGSADADRFLNSTVASLAARDREGAANLLIGVGDVYRESGRYDDAITQYNKALGTRGVMRDTTVGEENRDFAVLAYGRIIQTLKLADRFADAKNMIVASQKVLGDEDSFTDRELITLYREYGKRAEALQAVKFARMRFPQDYGFLRLEALLLAETGRVDEGVSIVKSLIGKQNPASPSIMYDDFTNYLYISVLYAEAKRGKDAVAAANQALAIAADEERKQIASVTLATAQQVNGDFAAAEANLRAVIKASPRNPVALNNLGYFLTERDQKLDEALKFILQAVEIDPENSSYLDSLGWVYFKLGKFESAETSLKKAVKLDPMSPTTLDHLGDTYQKLGKPELARQHWQRALTFATDPAEVEKLRTKLGIKKAK